MFSWGWEMAGVSARVVDVNKDGVIESFPSVAYVQSVTSSHPLCSDCAVRVL